VAHAVIASAAKQSIAPAAGWIASSQVLLAMTTRWPWISMLLTAIVALSPLGRDVIHAAFLSNEALSRNIWESIALTAVAIAALIVLLEWRIRVLIFDRRARGTTTS
jgi:hypothetical protein